jgi:ATP-dependent helicase/nuclease subunit A
MPFAFYARVLGAERGRKRFLARLGHEAEDALDEFLNLALEYEHRKTPSLQGFVAWLRTARTDVKRDMEITRDEVRVMTVHGAKGLEANIVVLLHHDGRRTAQHQPRLRCRRRPANAAAVLWGGLKATDKVIATARGREA